MCGQDLTPEHRVNPWWMRSWPMGRNSVMSIRENQARINDLDTGQKNLESDLQTIFRLET